MPCKRLEANMKNDHGLVDMSETERKYTEPVKANELETIYQTTARQKLDNTAGLAFCSMVKARYVK